MGIPGITPEDSGNSERLSALVVGQRYLADYSAKWHTTEELIGDLCQQVETLQQSKETLRSAIDSTRWKLIEKELRERDFQLSEAQRIAHIGSWELDLKDHSLRWSEETFHIFGQNPASFLPTKEAFLALVHPEDRERVQAADREISAGLGTREIEHRILRPDGSLAWVYLHAEIQTDPKGRPTNLLGICQDITQRKVAESEIRKSDARYRAVVEQAGEIIFLFNVTSKRIVEANAAFHQSLGYSDEDLETLTMYDLVEADRETVDRNVARVLADKHYILGRRLYRHKDGRIREVEVSANHLHEIDQDLLCAVARDVTDQIRAEAALLQAQKLESLGLLAGGIAHDFNNLLTAILGNLNLAQMNLPEASPILTYLRNIEGTVLCAADLTRQMLTYSGKGRFLVHAVNLRQVINEMTHLLMVSISKKVVLHIEIPEELPALEADPTQIQQIVMNLIINASEAIGDVDGTIAIAARPANLDESFISTHLPGQPLTPGPHVIFEISDTGDGMSPETISKIFDPFFTTKSSGRGLGLSAMRGILKSHHAGINIYSEIGRGSTFRIYFPAHQKAKPALESSRPPARRSLPTGTVLIVDDEATIRATAGAMFESLGFKVLEAADGIEAVEVYKRRSGDIILVLLDLTMPHMDGKATFHAIQDMNPMARIILSSGYDQDSALRPFMGTTPAGFLKKPYQYKDLRAELEKILFEKAPED
jgi:PAS domain S-box-containing protein